MFFSFFVCLLGFFSLCYFKYSRAVKFRELFGARNQNMKKIILQFFLRLRPSNCVSVLTLRKSDKQKKKKVMFSLMCEILHAWRDVLHSCGRFYMPGVRV